MIHSIQWLFTFNKERILKEIDSLTYEQLFIIPDGLNTSPIWLIGHIIVTYNMCLAWGNKETVSPSGWDHYFKDGTSPLNATPLIPDIANFRDTYIKSHTSISLLLNSLEHSAYSSEINPNHEFPDKRTGILFECLTHDALHLSQLKLVTRSIQNNSAQ